MCMIKCVQTIKENSGVQALARHQQKYIFAYEVMRPKFLYSRKKDKLFSAAIVSP